MIHWWQEDWRVWFLSKSVREVPQLGANGMIDFMLTIVFEREKQLACFVLLFFRKLERVKGIEPSCLCAVKWYKMADFYVRCQNNF